MFFFLFCFVVVFLVVILYAGYKKQQVLGVFSRQSTKSSDTSDNTFLFMKCKEGARLFFFPDYIKSAMITERDFIELQRG